MQHIGNYVLNGHSPCPRVEMKFKRNMEDATNGCDLCFNAFGSNTIRRYTHFKCFWGACDPLKPTLPCLTYPNWKVHDMLKHTLFISRLAVIMERYISADEKTISCKGAYPDMIRINYKREGDRFQCDALCGNGYTYSFFRNQPAPKNE